MPKNPLLISKTFVLYSHCLFNTCAAVTTTAAVIPTAATLLITSRIAPHRKAARAVMILFPLFGMHFLLGLYRVPDYCGGLTLYAYYSKASDGLQGTFVAFLFCYLNGEVSTYIC